MPRMLEKNFETLLLLFDFRARFPINQAEKYFDD